MNTSTRLHPTDHRRSTLSGAVLLLSLLAAALATVPVRAQTAITTTAFNFAPTTPGAPASTAAAGAPTPRPTNGGGVVDSALAPESILIAALAVAFGLAVMSFVVYRLRRLDPARFMRAVANGGVFQGALLIVLVADMAIDLRAAVAVGDDAENPLEVVGLFSALTAVASIVSLVEIIAVARSLRMIVTGLVDIDEAAQNLRHESYAQVLTLCCEDIPMLIVTSVILINREDGGVDGILLAVIAVSAMMVGAKVANVRSVLARMLATRSYDTAEAASGGDGGREMRHLEDADPLDVETLEATLDDFAAAEAQDLKDDADEQEDNDWWEEMENGGGGGDGRRTPASVKAPVAVCHSAASRDSALVERVHAALADLRERPLDMNSRQVRLDTTAIILELAYPHRYGHLQRSAEATAQALTEASVSQNEFYAVVLPYLMLLYDKLSERALQKQQSLATKQSDGNSDAGGAGETTNLGGTHSSPLFEVIGDVSIEGRPSSNTARSRGSRKAGASGGAASGGGAAFLRAQTTSTEFSSVRVVRLRDALMFTSITGDPNDEDGHPSPNGPSVRSGGNPSRDRMAASKSQVSCISMQTTPETAVALVDGSEAAADETGRVANSDDNDVVRPFARRPVASTAAMRQIAPLVAMMKRKRAALRKELDGSYRQGEDEMEKSQQKQQHRSMGDAASSSAPSPKRVPSSQKISHQSDGDAESEPEERGMRLLRHTSSVSAAGFSTIADMRLRKLVGQSRRRLAVDAAIRLQERRQSMQHHQQPAPLPPRAPPQPQRRPASPKDAAAAAAAAEDRPPLGRVVVQSAAAEDAEEELVEGDAAPPGTAEEH